MRSSKLLLADALINLILGILLATFPKTVVELLGVPDTDVTFYPSILGAVLIGIGAALVIEYFRKPTGPTGLGLHGAIAINLSGALFLVGWLLIGKLDTPLRGGVFLWSVAAVLIAISMAELVCSQASLPKRGGISGGSERDSEEPGNETVDAKVGKSR